MRTSSMLVCSVALWLLGSSAVTRAAIYQFVNIVDSTMTDGQGNPFSDLRGEAISNGVVAFRDPAGIFIGSGGPVTSIVLQGQAGFSSFGDPTIRDGVV